MLYNEENHKRHCYGQRKIDIAHSYAKTGGHGFHAELYSYLTSILSVFG